MTLTLEDRIALQDLMTKYAYYVDVECSENEFLDLFTEDAIIDSPMAGRYEGVEGVKRFRLERILAKREKIQMRHVITNFLIEGDGNQATIKAYLSNSRTQLEVPPGVEPKVEFLYTGSYGCTARKIGGKWKLAHRTGYIDAQGKQGPRGKTLDK